MAGIKAKTQNVLNEARIALSIILMTPALSADRRTGPGRLGIPPVCEQDAHRGDDTAAAFGMSGDLFVVTRDGVDWQLAVGLEVVVAFP